MKLLVTGALGLLGSAIVASAEDRGFHVVAWGRGDLDVTDAEAVDAALAGHGDATRSDNWVVHCAAFTRVDAAESEAERCMEVNRDGSRHVARAAAQAGLGLVHFSTDYVFNGEKGEPYLPDDPPRPLNVYGRSKLAGDSAVREAHPGALGVRTGWLYGAGGGNFVATILGLAAEGRDVTVVDDQRGRPTWTRNLAEGTLDLMAMGAKGMHHLADGGDATWLELAREAIAIRGYDVTLNGVSSEAWGAPAARPRYSVLDVTHTEELLGRPMMPWRDALRLHLEETA